MQQHRNTVRLLVMLTSVAAAIFVATPSVAASLSGPISGWSSGVPGYISMYEYVPAKLAAKPPILVASHYCSGNAMGMFGEVSGANVVSAADQYGFVIIFPQTSNNCWDVGSKQSLTHNGGGDTQAIVEMVNYAISKHGGDANRVYAIGTSSGAMMTEALLAVYPDVFKAGAEFSGVPAGCWAASYSASNQWSGPCAGGMVTHTAQQWGDLVRAMDPGYSGYRPRIQLWHGTADTTISYNNMGEAIKEWTNVLGLSATPSSTDAPMSGYTRESWVNSCGFTVLQAWTQQNGGHTTPMNATWIIPFLGLDKSGPDPQVRCGDGGAVNASGDTPVDGGDAADGGPTAGVSSGSPSGGSGSNGSSGSKGPTSGGSTTGSSASMGDDGSMDTDSGACVPTAEGGGYPEQAASPSNAGCGCTVPAGGGPTHGAALVAASLLGIVLRGRRRRTHGMEISGGAFRPPSSLSREAHRDVIDVQRG
jgi:acetylxylan esterase